MWNRKVPINYDLHKVQSLEVSLVHVSVTWLHVFVTPISKHVASQYRWQSRDFNRRLLETCEEEETCVAGAIPKCTRYKNKWAAGIFDNLQRARFLKVATL